MAKILGKLELILGEEFFAPIKGKINKNLAQKVGASESKEKVELKSK
jgi:hypothetical protein